jgi:hypothetical protein
MKPIGSLVSQTFSALTSNGSNGSNENPNGRCSESQAARAALAIVGSFRRNDADDPQVLAAAFKRVLSGYPEAVVLEVADPLTGIAGKQTFLPSPAELKAELDKRMDAVALRVRRERERNETQKLIAAATVQATPEERERAVRRYFDEVRPGLKAAELQAQAGEVWTSIPNA